MPDRRHLPPSERCAILYAMTLPGPEAGSDNRSLAHKVYEHLRDSIIEGEQIGRAHV